MSAHAPEIETESFRIIGLRWGRILVSGRVACGATGDPHQRRFHYADPFSAGRHMRNAAHSRTRIVTRHEHGQGGIQEAEAIRSRSSLFVADSAVARQAREEGVTRSILAMRRGAADLKNGIFVIGNAPTALFELLRLVREEAFRPSLVVALPVGFVGAAESKERLVLEGKWVFRSS
jgi:precorrin isomerase